MIHTVHIMTAHDSAYFLLFKVFVCEHAGVFVCTCCIYVCVHPKLRALCRCCTRVWNCTTGRWLYSKTLGLSFDARSSTYFQYDNENGEYVAVPRSDAEAAVLAKSGSTEGGGGGGGGSSSSSAGTAAAVGNSLSTTAAAATVEPEEPAPSVLPAVTYGSDTYVGRKPTNEDRVVEDEDLGVLGRYFAVYVTF